MHLKFQPEISVDGGLLGGMSLFCPLSKPLSQSWAKDVDGFALLRPRLGEGER